MIEVTPTMRIPLEEIEWSYARSGGPGGQNVNKVASKALLRWAMLTSPSVPDFVKARVRELYPSRVTVDGDLIIASQEYRDQERNRDACVEKLIDLLRRGATRPKARRATKPSKGSKERRLTEKKKQSTRKADRKPGDGE